MSISTSRLAYTDCVDLMDRGIDDTKGVRVWFGNGDKARDNAFFFRMRCHQARKLVREDSTRMYEPGDPAYGVSIYDSLTFRVKQDESDDWWVYAEKTELNLANVESLAELEGEFTTVDQIPESPKPKQIEFDPKIPRRI